MPTFDFDPTDEGTALNATTLNTAFTELAGAAQGVNALDATSVERGALDAQHLPTLSLADIFTAGYTAISPVAAGTTRDVYDNQLPLTGGPAYPYTYQTFLTTGTTPVVDPYGVSTTANDTGWAIVSYLGVVADAAEVTVGAADSFTNWAIPGLLVRGSIDLFGFASGGNPGVTSLAMAIGVTDSAGTRYVIPRSVRFYSCAAARRGDVTTGVFITQDDLDHADNPGNGTFSSAYMVIATAHPDSGLTAGGQSLEIAFYNLTVLPLYAGDL